MIEHYLANNMNKQYTYYYRRHDMTNFKNIEVIYFGTQKFSIGYFSEIEKDYDRITLIKKTNNRRPIAIKVNGKKQQINKDEYFNLNNEFGIANGFERLQYEIIDI